MQLIRRNLATLLVIVVAMGAVGLASSTAMAATTTTTVKPTTTTTVKPTTTTTVKPTTTTTVKPTTTTTVKPSLPPRTLIGLATYYRPPAKGVYFGPTVVCASIKAIPMKTKVTITNLGNGKTATCLVGDRKAESTVRIIDLNDTVFVSLAPLSQGVMHVKLTW